MAKREAENNHIILNTQNINLNLSNTFTNKTSTTILKNINTQYIIINHSKHHTYHKKSNKLITKKFTILKKQNLTPILYINKTKTKNKTNKTKKIYTHQINTILKTQNTTTFKNTIITYKPI